MATTTFTGPVVSLNGFEASSTNGNTVALAAPAALAADYTLVLPPNDGSNGQVLTTDGNGVTTWTTNGAGTVTSVGGTGTVSGITLTGTVTSTGNLTLGGALSLASPPAIGGTAPSTGVFTDLTVGDKLIGAVQALTGPGAVNVTDPITTISATGAADAVTLVDGVAGQVKIVVYAAESDAGDSAVLTPTTRAGYASITFAAVGDSATLVFTAVGWAVVGVYGATVTP